MDRILKSNFINDVHSKTSQRELKSLYDVLNLASEEKIIKSVLICHVNHHG